MSEENRKSGLSIIQSNNLVSANYNLTITEQRIIYYAIARKTVFEDVKRVNMITAKDFAEFFGMTPTKAYVRLKEAAAIMYNRSIKIHNREGKAEDSDQRWLTNKAVYKQGEGAVRISFAPEILKELNDLLNKGEFTQYKLDEIIGMKNKYSIRLYTNMMKWKSIGKLKVSVINLREMFELEKKYKLYGDFKRAVIVDAIKEIEAHANLKVDLEEIKTGRSVTDLVIRFEQNKQQKLDLQQ